MILFFDSVPHFLVANAHHGMPQAAGLWHAMMGIGH
jgi:hypothetical protein